MLAGVGDQRLLIPLLIRPIPDALVPPDGDGRGRDVPWLDAASPYGYPGVMLSDALRRDPNRDALVVGALRASMATLAAHGVISVFLRSHPLLPVATAALSAVGTVIEHGETVSIDLTTPAAGDDIRAILPTIDRNHRRGLDRLARDGFIVDIVGTGDDATVRTFLEIYHGTMDRLAATPSYYIDADYVRALAGAAGGQASVALVRRGDTVAAAGLLTVVDGIVEDVFGGARPEFANLAPTKLKIPAVVRWGRARGHRVYHLGGGLGGGKDGLFRFKAGFSDRRHPFHTVRIVTDPARMATLGAIWATRSGQPVPPTVAGGFFPPYRAPDAAALPLQPVPELARVAP